MTVADSRRTVGVDFEKALAQEYADAAKRRGREHAGTVERWVRWCEETGHIPMPAGEQAMLRWVHSRYPNWSVAYVRVQGIAIRNWHLDNGLDDPRTDRWKRYLDALARDLGAAKEEHRVDEMTAGDLHAVNAIFRGQALDADLATVRARGAIAASVLLGLPLWPRRAALASERECVADIRSRDVRVDANGDIRLTHQCASTQIVSDRAAYLARCLRDAVTDCEPDDTPFTVSTTLRTRICQRIAAHHPGTGHGQVGSSAFWRDLPAGEVDWFLRTLGPKAVAGLRHSALLLTGTLQARRFQDLREIRLTDLQHGDDRIVYLQPRSKTDRTTASRRHWCICAPRPPAPPTVLATQNAP